MKTADLIVEYIKANIDRKDSEIAKKLKAEYPKIFKDIKTETLRRRIGEYRVNNNLPKPDEPLHVKLDKNKIKIADVVEEDKAVLNLKQSANEYKTKYIHLLKEHEKLQRIVDLHTAIEERPINKYVITADKKTKNEGTVLTSFSDWHIEERVDKISVNGINEYNPDIAKKRMLNYFKNLRKLIDKERQDLTIENVVIGMLGDNIHGFIHEEYQQTNYMTPFEASMYAYELLVNGLEYLLEDKKLKRIDAVCKIGNHCIEENTEVLTENGWKLAKDIELSDNIFSFNKSNGAITCDKVINVNKFSEVGGYKILGDFSNEIVTEGHNLVIDGEFVKAKDFNSIGQQHFRYAGEFNMSGVNFTDDELRLMTWVICDGTLVDKRKYNETGCRVQFKLSKQRKINELSELLKRMNIPYTFKKCKKYGINKLQPYYIRIYSDWASKICLDWLNMIKKFPKNFSTQLSKSQINIIIDSISKTDGRKNKQIVEWSSVDKDNLETIQIACILNNIPSKIKNGSWGKDSFKNRKPLYICFIYPDGIGKNFKVNSTYFNEKNNFVAIESVNGTLITRLNGMVNFTGNSRITMKPYTNEEAKMSHEWAMYRHLQKHFENESRINFIIDESYFTYLTVYDKILRYHHGHNVKYQGGIGGLTIPLIKYIYRVNEQQKADMDFIGHFHTQFYLPNCSVNGSLVGFNAYGVKMGMRPEEPVQIFQLLDKQRGFTVKAPILLNH